MMARKYIRQELPLCDQFDCCAYDCGYCIALTVNDYPDDSCPVFKAKERGEEE